MTSNFLRHIPCEACGSSDGNSLYDDGHEYCHVCQTFKPSDSETEEISVIRNNFSKKDIVKVETKGTVKSIPDRGITQQTCEKFGVTQDNGKHYYPYTDAGGTRVAYKVDTESLRSILSLMILSVCVKMFFGLFVKPESLFSLEVER